MYNTFKSIGFMKREEAERFVELYGGSVNGYENYMGEYKFSVLIRNSKEDFEKIRKDLKLKKRSYKLFKGCYYVFIGV